MKSLTKNQKSLLLILSSALFEKKYKSDNNKLDFEELKTESLCQTVYTLIYPVIKDKIPSSLKQDWKNTYNFIISQNLRIDYEHTELHKFLTDNHIPYTVLKGFSAAYYYSEPLNRMMGDVDFLVFDSDVESVQEILLSSGFESVLSHTSYHTKFKRGESLWELHKSMGGIPDGVCGEKINNYLSNSINKSELIEYNGITCRIPDAFDHGLIMLIHVAKHIINGEGVGLRHICDWAVYVNKVDISEYKLQLEEIGLWKFACQLTAVCIKYLGVRRYNWCEDVPEKFIISFIEDVFAAGNFGYKAETRGVAYRMVEHDNMISSLSSRTKNYYPLTKKYPLLLPLCMIMYAFGFVWRRITGKMKWVKLSSIKDGVERKSLYKEFHLFEI